MTKKNYLTLKGSKSQSSRFFIKIKTVVVKGGETNVCVGSTARDALMYDYHAILPEDCIAGFDKELHRYGLQILDRYFGVVTTSKEIINIWNRQKKNS